MSAVSHVYNGYIALLDAVYYQGVLIGNISTEGLALGGDESESFEVWAAQQRSNPVDEMEMRGATLEFSGKMIHMIPKNIQPLMGGTVSGERWDAPVSGAQSEGPLKILSGSGATIDVKRAKLRMSRLSGSLGGEETVGVEFALKVLTPKDGSSPYGIYPTEAFIEATPETLTFEASGGRKTVNIEASGPFTIGNLPSGFSVEIEDKKVVVVAEANTTSSTRSGTVTFTLASGEKSVSVALSQSAS